MVDQSAAASHALANEAVELARLMGGFPIGAAANDMAARGSGPRHAVKPLYGKAYRSGAALAAMLARRAEPNTWEEF